MSTGGRAILAGALVAAQLVIVAGDAQTPQQWSPSYPGVAAMNSCGGATDLAYSLILHGTTIRPSHVGSRWLFRTAQGQVLTNDTDLTELAAAVWTVDTVLNNREVLTGVQRVGAQIQTANALLTYQAVQDALATGAVEGLKAVVTDGASLTQTAAGLTWDRVRSRLLNPPELYSHVALFGLGESRLEYAALNADLWQLPSSAYDVGQLSRIRNRYWRAQALEHTSQRLAAKLYPTTGGDLVRQALLSALKAALDGPSRMAMTVHEALTLILTGAKAAGVSTPLGQYADEVRLAITLRDATVRGFAKTASESVRTCGGSVGPAPRAPALPAPSYPGTPPTFPGTPPTFPRVTPPPAARQPTAAVETRWSGVLKNPSGRVVSTIDLDLRNDNGRLFGFITYSYVGFRERPYEIEGTIGATGEFQLVESTNLRMSGRVSGTTMTGVRPNAPGVDFFFALNQTAILPPGTIVVPVELAPSTPDWSTFLARFTRAVQLRDRLTLTALMSHSFEYGNAFDVPPATVLRELDSGQNWSLLAATLRLPFKAPTVSAAGRERRAVLNPAPCGTGTCQYTVFVSFARDQGGEWRWESMTFPGD